MPAFSLSVSLRFILPGAFLSVCIYLSILTPSLSFSLFFSLSFSFYFSLPCSFSLFVLLSFSLSPLCLSVCHACPFLQALTFPSLFLARSAANESCYPVTLVHVALTPRVRGTLHSVLFCCFQLLSLPLIQSHTARYRFTSRSLCTNNRHQTSYCFEYDLSSLPSICR